MKSLMEKSSSQAAPPLSLAAAALPKPTKSTPKVPQKKSAVRSGQRKQTPATTVVSARNGDNPFSIEVYSTNDIVSARVASGGWEREKVNAFTEYFLDYSLQHTIPLSQLYFVDIGANIGWFSLSMAALGINVLAFEPMQENIDLIERSLKLEKNIKLGISDRITLFKHGLGVKDQTCVIYSHNINVGDGHVRCIDGNGDMEEEIKRVIPQDYSIKGRIPVRRLDDVIEAYKKEKNIQDLKVVCVKMDTEGYEGNVIEGGSKFLLESGVDVIITEFVPEWIKEKGGDPVAAMTKIRDAGYRLSTSRGNGYVTKEQMVDMKHLPNGDLTFHSPTFAKKDG